MNLEAVKKKRKIDEVQQSVFLNTVKCNINNKKMKSDIVNIYRRTYRVKSKTINMEWRTNSKNEMFLFDHVTQRINVLVDHNVVMLVPPLGCTKKVEKYIKPSELFFNNIPKLTKDTLLHIFSFLPSHELIVYRTVCKDWNRIITQHDKFWELSIPYNPPCWEGLSKFRLYIQHMFLNTDCVDQIRNFLVNNLEFFEKMHKYHRWHATQLKDFLSDPNFVHMLIKDYRLKINKNL